MTTAIQKSWEKDEVLSRGPISESNGFEEVILLRCGKTHHAALRKDGTVVAEGDNQYGQCDVDHWVNISSITVGDHHTVGLRQDGTVVAAGLNDNGQCEVASWRDIVSIAAGENETSGVCADGTVVCTVLGEEATWQNIVKVVYEANHTRLEDPYDDHDAMDPGQEKIGLRRDGTTTASEEWDYLIDVVQAKTKNYRILVGLKGDGRVVVAYPYIDGRARKIKQQDVQQWEDIVAVTIENEMTPWGVWIPTVVGLRRDGTVVQTDKFEEERVSVNTVYLKDGQKVIEIEVGLQPVGKPKYSGLFTFANRWFLRENGFVDDGQGNKMGMDSKRLMEIALLATGAEQRVPDGLLPINIPGKDLPKTKDSAEWKKMKAIGMSGEHTVARRQDGSVAAFGRDKENQCQVDDWSGIRAIAVGKRFTAGLKEDGTIVCTGKGFARNAKIIGSWQGINAISAGDEHVLALDENGFVKAEGSNKNGQCNVDDWVNITAISAGAQHSVGLCKDGSVVAAGRNHAGQCNVNHWKHIKAIAATGHFTHAFTNRKSVIAEESAVDDKKPGDQEPHSTSDLMVTTDGVITAADISLIDIDDPEGYFSPLLEVLKREQASETFLMENNLLFSQDRRILYACFDRKATSLIIPDHVKEIEKDALRSCNQLNEITLPPGLTRLGENALPDSLTIIHTQEGTIQLPSIMELEHEEQEALRQCLVINQRGTFYDFDQYDQFFVELKRTPLKIRMCRDRLLNPLRLSARNRSNYEAYLAKRAKKAISEFVESQNTAGLQQLIDLKQIHDKNIDEYIVYADSIGRKETVDFLTVYRHEVLGITDNLKVNPSDMAVLKRIWTFEKVSEDTLMITKYKGKEAHVTVPSTAGKKQVTQIGAGAFKKNTSLQSVTTEEGIKAIMEEAFKDCRELLEVRLPQSLETIGDGVFEGCYTLQVLNLPEKITQIGHRAFHMCSNLRQLTIPEGVQAIGDETFEYCTKMVELNLPKSIISIGESAFTYCFNLKKVNIPETVRIIGDGAFQSCKSLEELKIPEGVTSIGKYAFKDCERLKGISLPPDTKKILENTFSGCHELASIKIPSQASEIGNGAFSGCEQLTEIVIPESVSKIWSGAFSGCKNLTEVTIPPKVTVIWSHTFSNCINLKKVNMHKRVKEIKDHAFARCTHLNDIELPEGITEIHWGTFYQCSSLSDLSIPKNVSRIGSEAFYGCRSLTRIDLPENVKIIERKAFKDCSSLNEIAIPDSVAKIEDNVFNGCPKDITVYVSKEKQAKLDLQLVGLADKNITFKDYQDA